MPQSPEVLSESQLTYHYNDVIMGAVASQITSLTIVYSTVYSGADQRKLQSSASLAFVRGIHRSPVNSPHKGPVTRKMIPLDDVIMWHNDNVIARQNDVKTSFWCNNGVMLCMPWVVYDILALEWHQISTAIHPTNDYIKYLRFDPHTLDFNWQDAFTRHKFYHMTVIRVMAWFSDV